MPPPLLKHISSVSLPQHCEPTSPFLTSVSSYLSLCLPTPLAFISFFLGTLSIISWLFAQLPQIYKNYQLQSTSGLSIFFLVIWCLGDSSNLVGAVLTRQAGWQVVIAAYYVFVDVTLVFQFFWYTHLKARKDGYDVLSPSGHDGGSGGAIDGVSLFENECVANATRPGIIRTTEPMDMKIGQGVYPHSLLGKSPSYAAEKYSPPRRSTTARGSVPNIPAATRTVLLTSMLCAVLANASATKPPTIPPTPQDPDSTAEIVGRIFSWMSTILYLGSRPPQLFKNYRRKSTSGLSPLLFTAAFCGNLFYSTSLLTNPNAWYDFPPYGGGGWADSHGNNRIEWVGRAIPFFLGAAGVLGLDGYMGVQFLMYGSKDGEAVVRVNDPVTHRSRWTRVRGWMKGWIPSVSPDRRASTTAHTEGRALLDDERNRYGTL
ncbi:PQ loop repeat protein [Aspergillus sclerotialis]|uniref:PQ loop repeat protein n=1 Tax=Aspergillus sclerotialis TaxID=2070753 RepID=A0A3A2ZX99_9EURO|nr:PQ loop repeat protein [Aspergillus sclerotialis]